MGYYLVMKHTIASYTYLIHKAIRYGYAESAGIYAQHLASVIRQLNAV
jgi:hypothetical protein